MGIMVFPGFSGTEVLYNDDGKTVVGVATGDKGVDRNGGHKSTFEPGVNLTARVTVFGEGPRGSLIREVGRQLGIFSNRMPQVYETAIKEVIRLPETSAFLNAPTTVIHTFGYPLGMDTKGGGFLYKMKDDRVSLGLVVGLDYTNPLLDPYDMFIRYKRHPLVADIIRGGKVLQQGAKTLSAGGYYTMPQLAVDGALFVGDSASMLNIQRLKGIHTAMKSGLLAAETIVDAIEADDYSLGVLEGYAAKVKTSWIHDELFAARNFAQALGRKGAGKFIHIAAQYATHGRGLLDPMPIEKDSSLLADAGTLAETADSDQAYDSELYVDKLTGVYLSGTRHEEDQPCHLHILDEDVCVKQCTDTYQNPCTRFCPGQVYEVVKEEGIRVKLNPSNCLHCKTCEIKDPYENIIWVCPEGGGGPNYSIC
jgi:electron-transferring-flavoprotein dehydrogenase